MYHLQASKKKNASEQWMLLVSKSVVSNPCLRARAFVCVRVRLRVCDNARRRRVCWYVVCATVEAALEEEEEEEAVIVA